MIFIVWNPSPSRKKEVFMCISFHEGKKMTFNWMLVELKVLDLIYHERTGNSILTSATDNILFSELHFFLYLIEYFPTSKVWKKDKSCELQNLENILLAQPFVSMSYIFFSLFLTYNYHANCGPLKNLDLRLAEAIFVNCQRIEKVNGPETNQALSHH